MSSHLCQAPVKGTASLGLRAPQAPSLNPPRRGPETVWELAQPPLAVLLRRPAEGMPRAHGLPARPQQCRARRQHHLPGAPMALEPPPTQARRDVRQPPELLLALPPRLLADDGLEVPHLRAWRALPRSGQPQPGQGRIAGPARSPQASSASAAVTDAGGGWQQVHRRGAVRLRSRSAGLAHAVLRP